MYINGMTLYHWNHALTLQPLPDLAGPVSPSCPAGEHRARADRADVQWNVHTGLQWNPDPALDSTGGLCSLEANDSGANRLRNNNNDDDDKDKAFCLNDHRKQKNGIDTTPE